MHRGFGLCNTIFGRWHGQRGDPAKPPWRPFGHYAASKQPPPDEVGEFGFTFPSRHGDQGELVSGQRHGLKIVHLYPTSGHEYVTVGKAPVASVGRTTIATDEPAVVQVKATEHALFTEVAVWPMIVAAGHGLPRPFTMNALTM